MMSPDKAIMLALATGSAARMNPNPFAQQRTEVDAYQELVDLLTHRYRGIDARILEIASGSQERQQLLAEQIRSSGAATSGAVLRQARRVLRAVQTYAPQAITAIFAEPGALAEALLTIEQNLEVQSNGTKRHTGHSSPSTHSAAPAHLPAL
jgi:hypothetical protein